MHEEGHKPTETSYPGFVSEWIKLKLLQTNTLDCNEILWMKNFVDYFCPIAKRIWSQHNGKITGKNVKMKHAGFFNKCISPSKIKCTEFTAFQNQIPWQNLQISMNLK